MPSGSLLPFPTNDAFSQRQFLMEQENESSGLTRSASLGEPPDFSLVLGGPLYQLWRRTRLAGDALQLVHRRIVATVLLAWVPLLLLSFTEGHALPGSIALPFLCDLEMHVRLLVVLPLLIVAELIVHQRIRPMVGQFLKRGLVAEADREKFAAAVTSAMRLRNSLTAEVLLIAFVYIVGVGFIWRTQVALDVPSWHGLAENGKLQPSLAGWWMGLVSLPVFQFLLYRWYFRFFVWGRFLWQVAHLKLNLLPTHPDRCGGLGFLAGVSQAFAPLLFAQGALLAGMMADRIFFAGAQLPQFKIEILGLVAVIVFFILGPLLVFALQINKTRRAGLLEYGALAYRYAAEFDAKWLRGGAPAGEQLVGSGDIQSLADMGGSYDIITEMKVVPFTLRTVLQLGVTTLLPVAPLLLTIIPLDELVNRLLKLLF